MFSRGIHLAASLRGATSAVRNVAEMVVKVDEKRGSFAVATAPADASRFATSGERGTARLSRIMTCAAI